MNPTPDITSGSDDDILPMCFDVADKILAEHKIDPKAGGHTTVRTALLRIMLANAAANGYGEAGKYLKRVVAEERAAFSPQGAAIEHGRSISVITDTGEKQTPPSGIRGWLAKLLR